METGRVAKQANGAVWLQLGETVVMVTACRTKTPEDRGFLPLIVERQRREPPKRPREALKRPPEAPKSPPIGAPSWKAPPAVGEMRRGKREERIGKS